MIDGTGRVGVLELTVADMSDAILPRYRTLASLMGLVIVGKSLYSDTYSQTRRSQQMALQAELVWAFLAPRTFATDRVMVAATLEPAYEAGGDAYDYSLIGDRLHVSISQSGTPAPEMLRRLNRSVTEYQHGQLSDDTTIVLIEGATRSADGMGRRRDLSALSAAGRPGPSTGRRAAR